MATGVKTKKKCNCKQEVEKSKLTQLKEALFYDYKREQLSRTALMSFVFFCLAVIVAISGLVAGFMGKELPTALYTYIGALVGGGFLNYSFGKKLTNGFNKE